jgi:hypothetical protein
MLRFIAIVLALISVIGEMQVSSSAQDYHFEMYNNYNRPARNGVKRNEAHLHLAQKAKKT